MGNVQDVRPAGFVFLICLAMLGGCDSARPIEGTAEQTDRQGSETGFVETDIHFVQGYTRGFEQARQEGKPILVFFSAPQCIYCDQMVEETFADSSVVHLSKQFVCIQVDAEQEPEVCQEFRVQGYPTVQFMSPRGVPLTRFIGKRPARQIAAQMQATLQATASRTAQSGRPVLR